MHHKYAQPDEVVKIMCHKKEELFLGKVLKQPLNFLFQRRYSLKFLATKTEMKKVTVLLQVISFCG
jgi:hypothetical protein